ncbi:MAG: CynX/NimT family MFS transporter [Propioniciclava sp.]
MLLAFAIRPLFGMLAPITAQVSVDIPLSLGTLSLLGALPPVTFAAMSLLTPLVVNRWGLHGPAIAALGLVGLGELIRAVVGDVPSFVLATWVGMVGIGMGNVLLPPMVKRHFPERITVVTASYAAAMAVASALPPALAVPVAHAAGWRVALGCWAMTAVVAMVPWVWVRRSLQRKRGAAGGSGPQPVDAGLLRRTVGSPVAWALLVVFAVPNFAVYSFFAWLPQIFHETVGVPTESTGGYLAAFAIMGFVSSLILAAVGRRGHSPVWFIYVTSGGALLGLSGLLWAPSAAPWAWAVGLGLGATQMLVVFILLSARTRTHQGTVVASGFVQGPGFLIGAMGPLLFGLLRETTGGWTAALVIVGVLMMVSGVAALILRGDRIIGDPQPEPSGIG